MPTRNHRLSLVLLSVLAVASVACSGSDEDTGASSEISGIHDGWHMRQQTSRRKLCWENIALDDAFVLEARRAIHSELNARTSFKFIDLGSCPASLSTIEMTPVRFLGEFKRPFAEMAVFEEGISSIIYLSHEFCRVTPGTGELTQSQIDCVQATMLHEGGHVLGLEHEHSRADAPTDCGEDFRLTGANAVPIGPYDPRSLMNYCNAEYWTKPVYSTGDIITIETLYSDLPGHAALVKERGATEVYKVWKDGHAYCSIAGDEQLDAIGGGLRVRTVEAGTVAEGRHWMGKCSWPDGFFRRSNQLEVYRTYDETKICWVHSEEQMMRFGGFELVRVVSPGSDLGQGRDQPASGPIPACEG